MSAPFFVNFNYNPELTIVHTSGNYTVASGKFARVTANTNTTSTAYILNSVNVTGFGLDSNNFWLKSGDVINPQNGTILIISIYSGIT